MGGCMSANIDSKNAKNLDNVASAPILAAIIAFFALYKVQDKNNFNYFSKLYLLYLSIVFSLVILITKNSVQDCKEIDNKTILKNYLTLHFFTILGTIAFLTFIFLVYLLLDKYTFGISVGLTVLFWLITSFVSALININYPCDFVNKCRKNFTIIEVQTNTPTSLPL